MTNSNDNNTNNSTTTQEQPTLLKDVNPRRLTPEQRAKMDAIRQPMIEAMLKDLAQDNQEIFGTPIPEHLKG